MNIKGQGHSLILLQGNSDSTFSNFFSWETAMPIEGKFHVDPHWDRGTKVHSNGPGHMTKMAAMLIYGKNIKKKSSSLEPQGRWPWKFVYSFKCSSTTKFAQMMILCCPRHILRQGQLWSPMLLYGKKLKQWIFSETSVVYDIKVGICSQLNEYMKLYEYQRSRSLTVFGPNLSDSIVLNFLS